VKVSKIYKTSLFLPALLMLVLYFCPNNFELYTRVGWVDAGMYVGYINNDSLIKDYGFTSHNYQGSRLGYTLPAKLFLIFFNPILGRFLFVLSYYITALIFLFFLAKSVLKRIEIQSLFITVIISNPLLLAGLSYGGSDGPAAIYVILASIFLYLSVYYVRFIAGFLILAGLFAALSVSTHILTCIPLAIIFLTYIVLIEVHFKNILIMVVAFLLTILFLSIVGYYLGMTKHYLLYSYDWSVKSITNSDVLFRQPINEWILYAFIYVPSLYLFLIIFYLLAYKKKILGNKIIFASGILCTSPLLFVLLFDLLLRGSLSQYISYFQLLFPCLIFSFLFFLKSEVIISTNTIIFINYLLLLLFILSVNNSGITFSFFLILGIIVSVRVLSSFKYYKNIKIYNLSYLAVILFVSQYYCFAYNKSLLPFYKLTGNANTKSLYLSELHLIGVIKNISSDFGMPLFIYDSALKENDFKSGQSFQVHFNGEKRLFNYFDSLTALYLWDRSILTNNAQAIDFEKIIKHIDKEKLFVVLGRDQKEVNKIYNKVISVLSDIQTIVNECYYDESYPWCIKVFKKISN
jgi:hypothetical protein